MTQIDIIIKHIDDQMSRLFDPLRKDVDAHNEIIPSLKSGQAVNRTHIDNNAQDMAEMKTRQDKIEEKLDALTWKLAVIVGTVSVLVQLAFHFL